MDTLGAPAPSWMVRLIYTMTPVRRHLVRAFAAEVARAVAGELPEGAMPHVPETVGGNAVAGAA